MIFFFNISYDLLPLVLNGLLCVIIVTACQSVIPVDAWKY